MAEFLTTKQIAAHLEQIIVDARQQLFLVSPYIKADRQIRERLASQANSNSEVRISVIYGKKELPAKEWDWLKDLPSVELRFRQDLHAKCYLNEQVALVTSMNLYDFSEVNNDEMGILVSAKDDRQLYNKVRDDVLRIAENSEVISKAATAKPTTTVTPPVTGATPWYREPQRRPEPSVGIPASGFCIRCRTAVPLLDPGPYCNRCFRVWNRFQDEEYEENHCHLCGKENDSTYEKPLCYSCYRKYKDILDFDL